MVKFSHFCWSVRGLQSIRSVLQPHIMTRLIIFSVWSLSICLLAMSSPSESSSGHVQPANAARYDNYRLYRLHLETDEQVKIFVELEEVSDSVIFYGHARQIGQKLTIMVAAHKVADITELLQRFNVEHQILVSLKKKDVK